MPYQKKRSDEEILNLVDRCDNLINEGSILFCGCSYEEGVKAALDWVFDEKESDPLAE